jgi:hypothetical protein
MMHALATAFFSVILVGSSWAIVSTLVQAKRDYDKMMHDLDRLGRDDD